MDHRRNNTAEHPGPGQHPDHQQDQDRRYRSGQRVEYPFEDIVPMFAVVERDAGGYARGDQQRHLVCP